MPSSGIRRKILSYESQSRDERHSNEIKSSTPTRRASQNRISRIQKQQLVRDKSKSISSVASPQGTNSLKSYPPGSGASSGETRTEALTKTDSLKNRADAMPATMDSGAYDQVEGRQRNISSPESPPESPVGKDIMKSGSDVVSESNDTPVPMDQSVEPMTDDDATLTSVRRIMAGKTPNSPRSPHRYQPLQEEGGPYIQTPNDTYFQMGSDRSRHQIHGKSRHKHQKHIGSRSNSKQKSDTRDIYGKDRPYLDWLDEEKPEKLGDTGGVFRTASSSDYDTDGDLSKTSRQSTLEGTSQSQTTDMNEFFAKSKYSQASRKMDDDDRTFDYGDRDDESNGSATYAARRRKERERRAREAAKANNAQLSNHAPTGEYQNESRFMNKDDVEHYTKELDPATKLGAGVVAAVTVGCIILGPVGLLVGAAAVGISVRVMRLPEEERNKLQTKVQTTFNVFNEKAVEASKSLSSSCGATYNESGVAEHLPKCLAGIECLSGADKVVADEPTKSEKVRGGIHDASSAKDAARNSSLPKPQKDNGAPTTPTRKTDRLRNKKVACLRNVPILSAGQIHGLDPSAQPRAWLDVVASANTTNEEKHEAMEEILILAKDKRRARIFLDEGILDYIVWTLSRYLEKVNANEKKEWANAEITPSERSAAKLAASCCMTLGKAHCAAIHTEGDLLLMSLYERGNVPEERQVAQMLHEVPHHTRITKTADPTVIEPSKEVFALKQLSLPQAEELAVSVKAVADGDIPNNLVI